jgi:serine/threonine protein phosphatase PrpC
MAAETLRDSVHEAVVKSGARRPNARVVLMEGYEQACHKVYDTSQEPTNDLNGMGTTLVAALLHDDTLFIANVGDSRAYLFTNNHLWQITEDHSLMNEQLRAGLITEKDIARYQGRNVITRSVGYEREIQVDIIERKIYPGEIILMCSDGLSGLVSDQRIAEICRIHKPSEIVSICINEAKKNGGDDNVTVMVLYADGQDEVTKV